MPSFNASAWTNALLITLMAIAQFKRSPRIKSNTRFGVWISNLYRAVQRWRNCNIKNGELGIINFGKNAPICIHISILPCVKYNNIHIGAFVNTQLLNVMYNQSKSTHYRRRTQFADLLFWNPLTYKCRWYGSLAIITTHWLIVSR